jgi:hypothetical protein
VLDHVGKISNNLPIVLGRTVVHRVSTWVKEDAWEKEKERARAKEREVRWKGRWSAECSIIR